jgi:hypothetical protein
MVDLKKRFEDSGLTESTAKVYLSNLIIMNNGKAFKSCAFLKNNMDNIFRMLEEKADNTRITYMSSALKALHPMRDEAVYKNIYKRYSEELALITGEQEKIDPNEKSQREIENWIDWSDVLAKAESLKKRVLEFSGIRKNSSELTEKEYSILLDWIVLGCYAYMNSPRRNKDFLELLICQEPPTGELDIKKNYYIKDNESAEFIFNVFKTVKFEGVKVIQATEEMIEMMNIWMKFHPGNINKKIGPKKKTTSQLMLPMFVNQLGNNIAGLNFITLRLNKIFKKKIGASMLRHSFLTYKFGDVMNEMKDVASDMSHSVEQQRDYIKK